MNSKNSKNKGGAKRPTIQNHFVMREPILTDVATSAVYSATTGSSGVASGQMVLTPLGLASASIVSGTPGDNAPVDNPHLRWLNTQALNFGSYRVLRAKLIFVAGIGSTTSGTIAMAGYKDASDSNVGLATAYTVGPYAKMFDLASGSTQRELSINLPVDTSWKKIGRALMVLGNSIPYVGANSVIVPVNTVNDLSFTTFGWQIVGAPANTPIGAFFLDYEVEFREPQAQAVQR